MARSFGQQFLRLFSDQPSDPFSASTIVAAQELERAIQKLKQLHEATAQYTAVANRAQRERKEAEARRDRAEEEYRQLVAERDRLKAEAVGGRKLSGAECGNCFASLPYHGRFCPRCGQVKGDG